MLEATSQSEPISLDFLLLEDEPLLRGQIKSLFTTVFDDRASRAALGEGSESPGAARVVPRFFETDNLVGANAALRDGRCDVLIADFSVKRELHSQQNDVDCLDLLRTVKEEKSFVLVVGHTAHDHLMEVANREHLAIETVSKDRFDSVQRVVETGKKAGLIIAGFRRQLREAQLALGEAACIECPVQRQAGLARAREMFRRITMPACLPADSDYRRALRKLVPVLHRTSTVASGAYNLRPFSVELVELVNPLVQGLMKSRFSYHTDGLPIFQHMEAKGYNVWMRLAKDED